ncbi:MAG TPA: hypothetical protein VH678_30100 [Xanthobacteraceae bacterium]|jgi:hypothetical protein
MFSSNPFTLLSQSIPPLVMQIYVILMILAVALGTMFDLWHKRSWEFFSLRRKKAEAAAQRELAGWEIAFLAARTMGKEVATSGEFCKWQRQVSHLLIMYGFVIYLVTTFLMVFVYPRAARTPGAVTALWNIGALMVLAGGLWFFFALKVNVAHEKHSPLRLIRADLFVGSLLASVAFGLLWHLVQTAHWGTAATLVFLAFYIAFSTLLFVSVPWSKFAHMFYKPAAAFQKRLEEASGASDLPAPAKTSNIKG